MASRLQFPPSEFDTMKSDENGYLVVSSCKEIEEGKKHYMYLGQLITHVIVTYT